MPPTKSSDGGPAFPCNNPTHSGISIRDWLAGQALAGFSRARGAEMYNEHTTRWYARVAYSLADAMLAERDAHQAIPLQKPPDLSADLWQFPRPSAH